MLLQDKIEKKEKVKILIKNQISKRKKFECQPKNAESNFVKNRMREALEIKIISSEYSDHGKEKNIKSCGDKFQDDGNCLSPIRSVKLKNGKFNQVRPITHFRSQNSIYEGKQRENRILSYEDPQLKSSYLKKSIRKFSYNNDYKVPVKILKASKTGSLFCRNQISTGGAEIRAKKI